MPKHTRPADYMARAKRVVHWTIKKAGRRVKDMNKSKLCKSYATTASILWAASKVK